MVNSTLTQGIQTKELLKPTFLRLPKWLQLQQLLMRLIVEGRPNITRQQLLRWVFLTIKHNLKARENGGPTRDQVLPMEVELASHSTSNSLLSIQGLFSMLRTQAVWSHSIVVQPLSWVEAHQALMALSKRHSKSKTVKARTDLKDSISKAVTELRMQVESHIHNWVKFHHHLQTWPTSRTRADKINNLLITSINRWLKIGSKFLKISKMIRISSKCLLWTMLQTPLTSQAQEQWELFHRNSLQVQRLVHLPRETKTCLAQAIIMSTLSFSSSKTCLQGPLAKFKAPTMDKTLALRLPCHQYQRIWARLEMMKERCNLARISKINSSP